MANKTFRDFISWFSGTYQGPQPVTPLDENGNAFDSSNPLPTHDAAVLSQLQNGGTAGTQYTDGAVAPAHPIGNELVFNNNGTMTGVSNSNPLPTYAPTNYAAETGGNLAAAKTDLDTIVTNTNKIPSSPATEGGHLAAIDTATAASKTDLDTLAGIVSSSKAAVKAASGDFADGAIATLGAKADSAITDSTTTNTGMSFIKGLVKIFADVWDSTNHALQASITKVTGLSLADGVKDATTLRVVTASDGPLNANLGATTDAAITSDANGSISGKMRGLVKIFADIWDATNHLFAMNVKQIGGQTPTLDNTSVLATSMRVKTTTAGDTALAVGQAAMAASIPVTNASDQTPLTMSTKSMSSVSAAAIDTALLSANATRKGAMFFNDSTAILYLSYGSGAASTTAYAVQIPAYGFFELPTQPVWIGAVRGIWSAATGAVRITELS